MLREKNLAQATLKIGKRDKLFEEAASIINDTANKLQRTSVALSGGSTPQAFYKWLVDEHPFSDLALDKIVWTVSDERNVPLESPDSNFGNALRLLLKPMGIPDSNHFDWPTQADPHSAAIVFNRRWIERFGATKGPDICFLGMDKDGHTASIFPGSPLLGNAIDSLFSCVKVKGDHWRFSITEKGLASCKLIVVFVTGKNKAKPLKAVLEGSKDLKKQPIQVLKEHADKTIWLVDEDAASLLKEDSDVVVTKAKKQSAPIKKIL